MAISLGGGGSASVINEKININSAENLITLADGRVYLKGGVTSTDTTTYPDATQGLAYTGTNFSTAGQMSAESGVAYASGHLWVLGKYNNTVYKYTTAGSYTGTSFSVADQDSDMFGLTDRDGLEFLACGTQNNRVSRYTSSGSFNTSFSIAAQTTTCRGLAWDGSFVWVVSGNGSASTIHKYNLSGTYQNVVYNITAQDNNAQGITWDGSFFWVCGRQNNSVYQFTAAGVYTGKTLSVSSQGTRPVGINFGASAYWVVDETANKVFKYLNQIGVVSTSSGAATTGEQNYVRIK